MADTITITVNETLSTDVVTVTVTETPEVVNVNVSEIGAAQAGSWADQGGWDASGDLFPAVNVKRGQTWNITVAGAPAGYSLEPGAVIRAMIDNPGQILANWGILN